MGLKSQIEQAVETLRQGGVIAFPTDTVYGLGASIYNREAVARIYELKRRPPHMALPVLVADVAQMQLLASEMPPAAGRLLEGLPTGHLTLVLRASAEVPDFITGGGGTVAVRITTHPVALALLAGLGSPIVATSANLSRQPSALSAVAVRAQLGNGVRVVVDGGPTPGGKESTIVDVSGESPRLLREGVISRRVIERLISLQ